MVFFFTFATYIYLLSAVDRHFSYQILFKLIIIIIIISFECIFV